MLSAATTARVMTCLVITHLPGAANHSQECRSRAAPQGARRPRHTTPAVEAFSRNKDPTRGRTTYSAGQLLAALAQKRFATWEAALSGHRTRSAVFLRGDQTIFYCPTHD